MLEKLVRVSPLHFGHVLFPNGMTLSIQAGPTLYSTPREFLHNAGGYEELEICPTEDVDFDPLKPY